LAVEDLPVGDVVVKLKADWTQQGRQNKLEHHGYRDNGYHCPPGRSPKITIIGARQDAKITHISKTSERME